MQQAGLKGFKLDDCSLVHIIGSHIASNKKIKNGDNDYFGSIYNKHKYLNRVDGYVVVQPCIGTC